MIAFSSLYLLKSVLKVRMPLLDYVDTALIWVVSLARLSPMIGYYVIALALATAMTIILLLYRLVSGGRRPEARETPSIDSVINEVRSMSSEIKDLKTGIENMTSILIEIRDTLVKYIESVEPAKAEGVKKENGERKAEDKVEDEEKKDDSATAYASPTEEEMIAEVRDLINKLLEIHRILTEYIRVIR